MVVGAGCGWVLPCCALRCVPFRVGVHPDPERHDDARVEDQDQNDNIPLLLPRLLWEVDVRLRLLPLVLRNVHLQCALLGVALRLRARGSATARQIRWSASAADLASRLPMVAPCGPLLSFFVAM